MRSESIRCLTCDYILDGLPEPRCPECGRAFDWSDPNTYRTPAAGKFPVLKPGVTVKVAAVMSACQFAIFGVLTIVPQADPYFLIGGLLGLVGFVVMPAVMGAWAGTQAHPGILVAFAQAATAVGLSYVPAFFVFQVLYAFQLVDPEGPAMFAAGCTIVGHALLGGISGQILGPMFRKRLEARSRYRPR